MTTLIIARHGNTFAPGDTVTYVGGRTDLPLAPSGEEQARAIGRYLREHALTPDVVYCSGLQRTRQTAEIAIRESGVSNPVFPLEIFNEIDYGPDENKPRETIIERIGELALTDWDEHSIVPPGWNFDPEAAKKNWLDFAEHIRAHEDNETVLVVTSNGIARYAPYIMDEPAAFFAAYKPKMATGALSIFHYLGGWNLQAWSMKP